MTEYYNQCFCQPCPKYSLIIEDDGKACYAYLLFDNKVIGDIWLYNQSETPIAPEWNKKEAMPFLNPKEFTKDVNEIGLLDCNREIEIQWSFVDDNCTIDQVKIHVDGRIVAVMKQNSKPGQSINAKKDGPLAKLLNHE